MKGFFLARKIPDLERMQKVRHYLGHHTLNLELRYNISDIAHGQKDLDIGGGAEIHEL